MRTQLEIDDVLDELVAARSRRLASEENIERDAQSKSVSVGTFMFGKSADRPESDYMLQRGTGSMLYFATDTFVLSAWTGSAWKSSTLS